MCSSVSFFFFNDTATTEIYTLSLHDALPIFVGVAGMAACLTLVFLGMRAVMDVGGACADGGPFVIDTPCPDGVPLLLTRSEEHTSELQSRQYLVCRLLLEKKKKIYNSQ